MSNYHGRLMNIQSGNGRDYYEGHRDARHAAAEIGCEADAEIERLRRELAEARITLAWIAVEGLSCGDYGACVLEALARLARIDAFLVGDQSPG